MKKKQKNISMKINEKDKEKAMEKLVKLNINIRDGCDRKAAVKQMDWLI